MHNSENVQRHYVRKFLMVIQLKNYVSFLFRNDSAWRYLGEHIFWNIKYVFYILSWSNQLVSPERKSSIKKEKLVYRLKDAEKDFLKMMRFPVILCTFSLFRVGIFYWTPLGTLLLYCHLQNLGMKIMLSLYLWDILCQR